MSVSPKLSVFRMTTSFLPGCEGANVKICVLAGNLIAVGESSHKRPSPGGPPPWAASRRSLSTSGRSPICSECHRHLRRTSAVGGRTFSSTQLEHAFAVDTFFASCTRRQLQLSDSPSREQAERSTWRKLRLAELPHIRRPQSALILPQGAPPPPSSKPISSAAF